MTFKKNYDSNLITGGGLIALGLLPIITTRQMKGKIMKKNDFIKILEQLSDKEICYWDDNEIAVIDEVVECKDKIVFFRNWETINQEFDTIKKFNLEK